MNVTREIDNFFPGTFNYFNVRVCDDEKTDLLKYWDDTFKYITSAKKNGSKVLVHCKMGVSRSASVVIAYAMKAYNWDFQTAMHHVKEKRTCIKPNTSFLSQLETYQGILDAMKNKEKLQRSKSETNLKSPIEGNKPDKILPGSEPTPIIQALPKHVALSGQDLRCLGTRPKSWSPDNQSKEAEKSPVSVSLEDLSQKSTTKEQKHVLMPCDNGESYSVSPNQIVHLPHKELPSVKKRISELESKKEWDPGDEEKKMSSCNSTSDSCDSRTDSVVNNQVWTRERRKDGDPFSNQLDRVFDREEKKQQRISVIEVRECPSRQSSWSSYDSAVVLGSQNDVGLSRHSSWGSGDTRILPSRNSSWGSYDMKPQTGIFPEPGTVKRTKQKIEENNMTKSSSSETLYEYEQDKQPVEAINKSLVLSSSAISPTIKIPVEEKSVNSRLSVSAPEASSMDLHQDSSLSRSTSNMSTVKQHGIVRSLKKEFEAKTSTNPDLEIVESKKTKVNSLPSSPVSLHQDKEKIEEMNFKNLLGLFEKNKEAQVAKRKNVKSALIPRNARYSCVEVSKWKNDKEKPAISPVVRTAPSCLVASVITSATRKQQQYGKSHPLARLPIKPRHNNTLYNTM